MGRRGGRRGRRGRPGGRTWRHRRSICLKINLPLFLSLHASLYSQNMSVTRLELGAHDVHPIHPLPPSVVLQMKWPEVICVVSVCVFVFTRCWVGYVIAANGVIAHFAKAIGHRCGDGLITYDTACNVLLIIFVIVTTTWQPWSLIVCVVGACGFAFSFRYQKRRPYMAAAVHCGVVMACGLINVRMWCRCCQKNAAETFVNRLSHGFVNVDVPL